MTVDDVNTYTYALIPGSPTLSLPTDGSVSKMNIVIDPNGNTAITEYAIAVSYGVSNKYVQADGTLGDSEAWQSFSGWGGYYGEEMTGLTANTQYNVKIKARNGNNVETVFGGEVSKYTYAPLATDMTLVDATTLTITAQELSFTVNGAVGYKLDKDTDCDDNYETNIYNDANGIPTSPRSFNYVEPNTCYKYRLQSYNSDGVLNNIQFAESNELITPHGAYVGITVVEAAENSISFDWPDIEGAYGYKFYVIYPISSIQEVDIPNPTSEYVLSGLNAESFYEGYIRVYNANGDIGIKK